MDSVMNKLGGRKFVLTLVCVAVGTAVELYTTRGVTAAFAGLLGTLVAAFGAANSFNTKQYLESGSGDVAEPTSPNNYDEQFSIVADDVNQLSTRYLELNEGLQAVNNYVTQVQQQAELAKKLAQTALKVNSGG